MAIVERMVVDAAWSIGRRHGDPGQSIHAPSPVMAKQESIARTLAAGDHPASGLDGSGVEVCLGDRGS